MPIEEVLDFEKVVQSQVDFGWLTKAGLIKVRCLIVQALPQTVLWRGVQN
jgi:hypothetical protein